MALTQPLRAWQLADVRRMAFRLASLVLVAAALAPSTAFAQFNNDPMNESIALDRFPHQVVLVEQGLPEDVTRAEVVAGIRQAVDTWNEVGCSAAELRWGGLRSANADFGESVTPIVFANPDDERCFGADTNIGWTVINACCSERGADDECVGRQYPPYTIFLNTRDYDWSADPDPYQGTERLRVDVRSVVTHELGHVLGLPHTADDSLATMAPRYLRDGGLATLAASDKQGACERYPQEVDECEVDEDCVGLSPCVDAGEWKVCGEYRGTVGEHCALDRLICPGECFVSSPVTYSGYCTDDCTTDDACPEDYVCDTEEEQCRLEVRYREEVSCATAAADPSPWWIVAGLALISRLRW